MGYNSLYIILNFGTLCWTTLIMPLFYALVPLLVSLTRGKFLDLKQKASRLMFFNYWLGFLNETYLFLAVCVGLNLTYFRWDTHG